VIRAKSEEIGGGEPSEIAGRNVGEAIHRARERSIDQRLASGSDPTGSAMLAEELRVNHIHHQPREPLRFFHRLFGQAAQGVPVLTAHLLSLA
jgi:hypothetical protein